MASYCIVPCEQWAQWKIQLLHFTEYPFNKYSWLMFFFLGMVHLVHICMLFSNKNRPCENRQVTMMVYGQMDYGCDSNETASFIIYYSYMEMKWWMEIYSVAWLWLFSGFWVLMNIEHLSQSEDIQSIATHHLFFVEILPLFWVNL